MEISLPSHLPAELGALLDVTNTTFGFIPSSVSWEAISYNPKWLILVRVILTAVTKRSQNVPAQVS